jgi:replicative DNA helicase
MAEFAQRVNTHIVPIGQISRQAKLNDDGRPSLNTIRDSGGWEEVCDNVLLLHSPAKNELDIIIAKQRDGEAGEDVVVRLPFNRDTLVLGNRDYSNVNDPKGISRLNLRRNAA